MKNLFNISKITSKGIGHEVNEDNLWVGNNIIAVVDGMGGEKAGDVASDLTVETIRHNAASIDTFKLSETKAKDLLEDLILKADKEITRFVDVNPDKFGMGATVVLAALCENKLYVAWCGDSRCLVFTQGNLLPLTKDHSYVQYLVDKGEITEEEAFTHPDNNVVTRHVGGGVQICNPDFISYDLKEEDIVILCTDGLSGYCTLEEIKNCISSSDRKNITKELTQLAVDKGSDDDITIVTITPNSLHHSSWRKLFSSFSSFK